MLNDISIENFRGFADLKLNGLGRVNLVVGRNNTGKTSLLEAISVIANASSLKDLPGTFRANPGGSVGPRFYRWLIRDGAPDSSSAQLSCKATDGEWRLELLRNAGGSPTPSGKVSVWKGEGLQALTLREHLRALRVRAVSVQHRAPEAMVEAFAEAVRPTEGEAQMESLLRSVDNRVKSIRLDYSQNATPAGPKPAPFIVVDMGLSERVPLAQAGQGIYRLVVIFSELLGQKPQVCFVDEIENGIHYTVLPQVWKGIAEVAERLDVQVFATTHSRECLQAAHEAFSTRPNYDLRVIQLFRLEDRTDGRVLDRAHIEAAVAGDIEVR